MDRPEAIRRLAGLVLEQERRAAEVVRLLHDGPGQTLTATGFHLRGLQADPAAIAEIGGYLDQALETIRLACNTLQANVVQRSDLGLAVELLAERLLNHSRFQVALRLKIERRLPSFTGQALYRIIQLALDNSVRHSGVSAAEVSVTASEGGMKASIRDTGRGFDVDREREKPSGIGLILMDAYARDAGLQFLVVSRPEQGTIVEIQSV
jgi:signal transduction histidine kinase